MYIERQMIKHVLQHVLFYQSSDELEELALDLQIHSEPLLLFCDRFDLGGWFYDQMVLASVDIVEECMAFAMERRREERDEVMDERDTRFDYFGALSL